MQKLSEFRKILSPRIEEQAREIAAKIEAGRNMSRFVLIEAELRDEVDAVLLEYAESLTVSPQSLNFEAGYLLNLRLIEAMHFAQFLEDSGFGDHEKTASDWIEFLAVDSWNEYLVNKWRTEFLKIYGAPNQ